LDRHAIVPGDTDYEEIRHLFQRALEPVADRQKELSPTSAARLEAGFRGAAHPPSARSTAHRTALVQVYNEMHGLIVGVGQQYCKKKTAFLRGLPAAPISSTFASSLSPSPQK